MNAEENGKVEKKLDGPGGTPREMGEGLTGARGVLDDACYGITEDVELGWKLLRALQEPTTRRFK